jgi:hypothetical protein
LLGYSFQKCVGDYAVKLKTQRQYLFKKMGIEGDLLPLAKGGVAGDAEVAPILD